MLWCWGAELRCIVSGVAAPSGVQFNWSQPKHHVVWEPGASGL